jgi:hypothetical protein
MLRLDQMVSRIASDAGLLPNRRPRSRGILRPYEQLQTQIANAIVESTLVVVIVTLDELSHDAQQA